MSTVSIPVKSNRPPGPGFALPGSRLLAFRRDPTGFLMELARTYGDIVYVNVGAQPLFLLNHPDFIRDVLITHHENFTKGQVLEQSKRVLGEGLLTSEGETHRRYRRLVQPVFHRARIAGYARVMAELADQTAQRWQDGTTLDVAKAMNRLTLAIVARTLFSTDVEEEADTIDRALSTLLLLSDPLTVRLAKWFDLLPFLPMSRRLQAARTDLDEIIYHMIAQHRSAGQAGAEADDLLGLLLRAQEAETGQPPPDAAIRDQALTILLAGHETTANALAWSWYLLSQHPNAEARLHAEVDTALDGRLPGMEDVARLPYTRMVLSESMRLYPPAWVIARRAIDDYEVGGYTVPAGSVLLMSQWVMHRDPRYYPEPSRFLPERWESEQEAGRPKYAYFPFGGGPRVCIGAQFAWTEGILLLATLAQHWRLRLVPGHPVALQPRITLRPKHGMVMSLEMR